MRQIKVFPKDSNEYKNLERIAKRMTEESKNGFEYFVDWGYFDSTNMKWTTIKAHDPNNWNAGCWQVLSPWLHEKIVLGLVNDDEIIVPLLLHRLKQIKQLQFLEGNPRKVPLEIREVKIRRDKIHVGIIGMKYRQTEFL